jgi:hypothetical protein
MLFSERPVAEHRVRGTVEKIAVALNNQAERISISRAASQYRITLVVQRLGVRGVNDWDTCEGVNWNLLGC